MGYYVADARPEHNMAQMVNEIANVCHEANEKWWRDIHTNEKIERNFGELIALCHSELSESLEAFRKSLMDDKLPNRWGAEVELADALIRIFDLAAGMGMDIGGAMAEKMIFNANRLDHTHEHRKTANGKKF